jgi:hypothetical protein
MFFDNANILNLHYAKREREMELQFSYYSGINTGKEHLQIHKFSELVAEI